MTVRGPGPRVEPRDASRPPQPQRYFEPARSSSLEKLGCGGCVAAARCVSNTCQVSQSYTEGSSWKAVQMRDKYYVGGDDVKAPPRAGEKWINTPFVFGCQTYETGLFRTQKADGIMGMSMHASTLVPQMRQRNKLSHNSFSLCFMHGGGTMALGGVDERIHKKPMQFVPLSKNAGWFTVALKDILVEGKSIGVAASVYATGKGTIVDSGTTDTYLPRRAAERFRAAWHAHMGPSPKYGNTKLQYTAQQAAKFPTLTYVFEGGVKVDVEGSAYRGRAGISLVGSGGWCVLQGDDARMPTQQKSIADGLPSFRVSRPAGTWRRADRDATCRASI